MHPSSFYDPRARYIYTPLHGPYSLLEALEGLVFYSLDESRDSISIGDTRCTGMNVKVWNMQNKDQVPQEKP